MSETKEPWEVEQIEKNKTTEMNKVENTPLGKRNEEEQGWKHSGWEGMQDLIRRKELEQRAQHFG